MKKLFILIILLSTILLVGCFEPPTPDQQLADLTAQIQSDLTINNLPAKTGFENSEVDV